jgi:hypothetical protein
MANGWPQLRLGPHIGLHPVYVNAVLKQTSIFGTTAANVAAAYDRLWNQDPRQHGVCIGTYKKVRTLAQANGWAPPGAWDDDIIDDPAAAPDWTGHCGTDRGWWMHSINDIPVCARCDAAHAQWKAERAHLATNERIRQLALAKGAASNRGATLAADARELLRITGHSVEQIAERLGVTKAHLYQELLRHPADEPATQNTDLAA